MKLKSIKIEFLLCVLSDIVFIFYNLAVHADGQYQATTFQQQLLKIMNNEDDPYFSLPWDTVHWMDRVMEKLREKTDCSSFFKRLIKRSNRLHTMVGHGRGHVEYVELAKLEGKKATETLTFATTRFFSSAFKQWERIYQNYTELMNAFASYREDEFDDCDETKYEVIYSLS